MNPDAKARLLVDQLQTVLEGTEGAVKQSPALDESLSKQEICVLRALGRHERCIMSAIAGAIRLSLSSATGLIDRLVEKKLVRRDRSHEDRRVVQVELTDEGRELHEAALEAQVRFVRGGLKALSPEEQDELLALLGKVSERIRAAKARV
ncbi:MAG: MarR family winged helix-turn-helix transcriptional regulator [Elusimicrobiota bacterium]